MAAVRQTQVPHGGIEGREDLIHNEEITVTQFIDQSRFAGVCVAHHCNCGLPYVAPLRACSRAAVTDLTQAAAQAVDTLADMTAIRLELAFAGS